jgi:hypothetical protein
MNGRDAAWRQIVTNLATYRGEDAHVHGNLRDLAPPPKLERRPPVKVRVVRPFLVAGKRYDVGETVTLPWPAAQNALACGRAEAV